MLFRSNGITSYDELDTVEMTGQEMIPDLEATSVEDIVLAKLLEEKLYHCLAELSRPEQDILYALYFDGLSERQVAGMLGVHHMTLHSRKVSALRKLKKMIEN